MIFLFRTITSLTLFIALIWLYLDPKFDSVFAACIALTAVIALFITPLNKKKPPNQSQQIKNGSTGIQAGGDVNMGSINTGREPKDAE